MTSAAPSYLVEAAKCVQCLGEEQGKDMLAGNVMLSEALLVLVPRLRSFSANRRVTKVIEDDGAVVSLGQGTDPLAQALGACQAHFNDDIDEEEEEVRDKHPEVELRHCYLVGRLFFSGLAETAVTEFL